MTDPTREDVDRLTTAAEANRVASIRLGEAIKVAFKPFRYLLWALVALMVLQLYGTWNLIDGRNTSRHNQEIIKQTQDTLLDCTDPQGDCAKQGAARSAAVVADLLARLSEASIAIGACTYEPIREDFQTCANAAIARIAAEAANDAAHTVN